MTICRRCIYDDTWPVTFNDDGVCSLCQWHDELEKKYPGDMAGLGIFQKRVKEIKHRMRKQKYDCIVGISGGCDSSYMLYRCVDAGLRCLAVNFNNGDWGTQISSDNIQAMIAALDVDFEEHRIPPEDYDAIVRAFFHAGVPDIEAPADMGIPGVLYRAAAEHDVKYIMEGHNFRTEGISPLGHLYMDGRYVQDVWDRHGEGEMPKSYPHFKFWDMVYYMGWKGIEKYRPLYHLSYHKEQVKSMLAEKFGWKDYGAHHGENKLTRYYHDYFMPNHYGINTRVMGWAALVRSGQMSREKAMHLKAEPLECPQSIVDEVHQRIGVFHPKTTHESYRTYKKTFRRTKPLWWLLWKLGRIPDSFFGKYCR